MDARNGVIARLGTQHGIATPVSDRVTAELPPWTASAPSGSDQNRYAVNRNDVPLSYSSHCQRRLLRFQHDQLTYPS